MYWLPFAPLAVKLVIVCGVSTATVEARRNLCRLLLFLAQGLSPNVSRVVEFVKGLRVAKGASALVT